MAIFYSANRDATSVGIRFRSSRWYMPLVAGLLLSLLGQIDAGAAVIKAASPLRSDVSAAIALASDGDTVIVPAGTASWTQTLNITKGITLQGQTTTDPVAGTANDQTIILDDVVAAPYPGYRIAITLAPSAGQTIRVSGFTFRTGSTTDRGYQGSVNIAGTTQATAVRVDHCHFDGLQAQARQISIQSAVYGVIDHNILNLTPPNVSNSFFLQMGNWGNNTDGMGDGSWAEPAYFGSEKFIFFEDNYINNPTSNVLNGDTDDNKGARWVCRHNHCYNMLVENHGTETGRIRSSRAREIYNNDFHWTIPTFSVAGNRGGGLIAHDNTYDGVKPAFGYTFQDYRVFLAFNGRGGPFYGATGDSGWDVNVTESDGVTHVDGHSPYLFQSGTLTGATSDVNAGTQTLTDTSKTWVANHWVGYTAKRISDNEVGLILSNTSNALTVAWHTSQGLFFASGDQYQIHKVLIALDQPCRGQGDLISGATPTAAWPHQALEPCYSWNNIYTPDGTHLNISPSNVNPPQLLVAGRDFYNDTPMPGYTPYTYPHPLVGGATPTPTPTPAPSPAAPTNLRITGP